MTAEAKQFVHSEQHTEDLTREWAAADPRSSLVYSSQMVRIFDALRGQISALTARVAELEGERERLTYALDLLADKWGDDSDSASVKPCCGSIYDECVHDLSEYRKMAALAPPEPQPSQEGG
jgi:hypothetical protein